MTIEPPQQPNGYHWIRCGLSALSRPSTEFLDWEVSGQDDRVIVCPACMSTGQPALDAIEVALIACADVPRTRKAAPSRPTETPLWLPSPRGAPGDRRLTPHTPAIPASHSRAVKTVVGVDPSDSGSGDSCGLIAASLTTDGVIAVIADQSAPMTSDEWATAAVAMAVEVGASEIAIEGFAARETYTRVVTEALKRRRTPHQIRVTSWPPKGSGRGGGDAMARSSALLQALEVGTCRIAGHLPGLEGSAVTWQHGQHQPDSLAALVVAHDVLVHSIGQRMHAVSPLDAERRAREGRTSPVAPYLRRRISG